MKQKKQSEKKEEQPVTGAETDNISETPENQPQAAETAPATPKTFSEEEYNLKVSELNDRYLRLHAEFDNFRKRTLKEKIEMSRTAAEDMIKDLLPVLDDFDRAVASFGSTENIEAVKEGVNLIQSKLKNMLAAKGLQEMKTMGEEFNTDFHEAITSIPAPSEDMKNKVLDEIQKGYLLHDKVIRFAKVVTGG
jgi:molecular chaperone GrpE